MNPSTFEVYRASNSIPMDQVIPRSKANYSVVNQFSGLKMLWKDARHFQLLYLGLFILYGVLFLRWDLQVWKIGLILTTVIVTQFVGITIRGGDISSWKSALITGFGLSILMRANEPSTLILGAFVAIASKFLIRHQGKHLFNPANIGIVAAILLTGDAWVSPGQWGSSVVLVYFIGAAALMVLLKVGRIDTSLMFIGTVFVLEYCRTILYLGWDWDVLFHKFSSGSFLLFSFFMITDPVTTPKNFKARMIWAGAIGVLSFIMTQWFFLHTAPLWALVVISPFTALLNHFMKGKTFHWV
jgi:Na+-transporting NADH:ubiquinone oxidoreductase subunit NqrB